jgi:hypothetical protein
MSSVFNPRLRSAAAASSAATASTTPRKQFVPEPVYGWIQRQPALGGLTHYVHIGAAADLAVEPLAGIVRPDLTPDFLGEPVSASRSERALSRCSATLGSLSAPVQDPVEEGAHGRGVGLVIDRVQQRPHPQPGRLWGGGHQVRRLPRPRFRPATEPRTERSGRYQGRRGRNYPSSCLPYDVPQVAPGPILIVPRPGFGPAHEHDLAQVGALPGIRPCARARSCAGWCPPRDSARAAAVPGPRSDSRMAAATGLAPDSCGGRLPSVGARSRSGKKAPPAAEAAGVSLGGTITGPVSGYPQPTRHTASTTAMTQAAVRRSPMRVREDLTTDQADADPQRSKRLYDRQPASRCLSSRWRSRRSLHRWSPPIWAAAVTSGSGLCRDPSASGSATTRGWD